MNDYHSLNTFGEPMLKKIKKVPPYWLDEKILTWCENELDQRKPFAISHYWNHSASINPFHIIGTDHPDYQGETWEWLIQNGKRMTINLDLYEQNKGYYQETLKKVPPMYYISMNGHDWYVHGDGNHRSCISRFHNHLFGESALHGVSISDWRINQQLFDTYYDMKELIMNRNLPFILDVQRKTRKRDDAPGWQKEYFETNILLKSSQKEWTEKTVEGVNNMKQWLSTSQFRKWFSKGCFKNVQSGHLE